MKREEFKAGARFRMKGDPSIYSIKDAGNPRYLRLYIAIKKNSHAYVHSIDDEGLEVGTIIMNRFISTYFYFTELELVHNKTNP